MCALFTDRSLAHVPCVGMFFASLTLNPMTQAFQKNSLSALKQASARQTRSPSHSPTKSSELSSGRPSSPTHTHAHTYSMGGEVGGGAGRHAHTSTCHDTDDFYPHSCVTRSTHHLQEEDIMRSHTACANHTLTAFIIFIR